MEFRCPFCNHLIGKVVNDILYTPKGQPMSQTYGNCAGCGKYLEWVPEGVALPMENVVAKVETPLEPVTQPTPEPVAVEKIEIVDTAPIEKPKKPKKEKEQK